MSPGSPARSGPGCCPLAERNLDWFPHSPPAGAWHAGTFRYDPERDAPPTPRLERCPFCGRELPVAGPGAD